MVVRNLAAERHLNEEIFSPGTFKVRNLSVLAYAQGFTLWHYKGGSTPLATPNDCARRRRSRHPGLFPARSLFIICTSSAPRAAMS